MAELPLTVQSVRVRLAVPELNTPARRSTSMAAELPLKVQSVSVAVP